MWLLLLLSVKSFSQDEILLTIDNQPVMRSEFERIYRKNNNIQGLENKTPAEYLELFTNFKLKVYEARKLGYDTLSAFRNELAGYRDQLAKPYLQDRPLIDSMLHEAYYRTVNEVNVSHIMIKLPAKASPADTLNAYARTMEIRSRILAGESFESLAKTISDDPSGKVNGGYLGWFSAFAMVLPFENAAYRLQVGEVSLPVRTRYGYHLIRLNDKRSSLGELKLAHIMIRAGRNDGQEAVEKARVKIDSCYRMLQSGSPFANVAKQYSEDPGTSQSGGQMRWIRSGELPPDIEQLVFALKDSGDYTPPVQSDYGWHIFRLEGRREIVPYDQMKSQLEERILADERGKIADASFISGIKKESGFISFPQNISVLASMMDSAVYSGNWKPEFAGDLIEPVFTIDKKEYTQKDLADFIVQTRQYRKSESLESIVNRKGEELIRKELITFARGRLENKYPEFKYLMEEYHDGILLFNIMDDLVWNKAVKDTIGLNDYYVQHAGDYLWHERADVSVYTLKDDSYLKTTRKLAGKRSSMKWTAAETERMICGNDSLKCVTIADYRYEKGDPVPDSSITWKKGFHKIARNDNSVRLIVVNDILPPAQKLFHEARGQVTADYQNYLDARWIESLRAKYPVIVNDAVLQKIHQ